MAPESEESSRFSYLMPQSQAPGQSPRCPIDLPAATLLRSEDMKLCIVVERKACFAILDLEHR
jgi:hypothetical protein